MSTPARTQDHRTVSVVRDKQDVRAWVVLSGRELPGFEPPSERQILTALDEAGISATEAVLGRVTEFLTLCREAKEAEQAELPERYLVAQGRPPREAVDGRFHWSKELERDLEDRANDEKISYYEWNHIVTVAAGVVVGTISPPVDGAPGVDVRGQELRPRRTKAHPVTLETGLRATDDSPQRVVAEMDGRVIIEGLRVRLEDVLHVHGDVNYATGNIDSIVNVEIHGSVFANFEVKSKRSVTVRGAIEAAIIDVGGDVTCLKGIVGQRRQGSVRASGIVTARYVNEANVEAERGIRVARSTIGSNIHTGGKLLIENGAIMGGRTHARLGIVAKRLGSEGGVATRVSVGVDPQLIAERRKARAEVEDLQQKIEKKRRKLAPLVEHINRLSDTQRQLLAAANAEVSELEQRVRDLIAEQKQKAAQSRAAAQPFVLVTELIHPGVRLSIGAHQTRFLSGLRGPVRIELRREDDRARFVAIDPTKDDAVVLLPTEELDEAALVEAAEDADA